ncbi:MAG: DUF2608 domain-containing protein [Pirellulales bacterium]
MRSLFWGHSGRPIAILLALMLASLTAASEVRETEEFADAVTKTAEYADQFGAENVLFVADIDNTLLAMNRDLGSDQWFEWQSYLLEHEPDSPQLVALDFPGLLAAQGLLFEIGRMHPPQKNLPTLIGRVQGLGVPILVLTSRGDDFRPATLRELKRAGYDFKHNALPLAALHAECDDSLRKATWRVFQPYGLSRLAESGLLPEEADLFNLPAKPRDVCYGDGIFMTAGQHKGAMLAVWMKLTGRQFKAVVYIDDHTRHVLRIFDAMSRRRIEVAAFHYNREADRVQRFQYGDKSPVTRQWRQLNQALELAR